MLYHGTGVDYAIASKRGTVHYRAVHHRTPLAYPASGCNRRRIGYKGGVLVVTILADEATARFHIAVASGSESYMHRRAIVSGEKCVVVTQPCQRYI